VYDLGYDLVVEDSEFPTLGSSLTTMAAALEQKLTAYHDSLTRVTGAAVKEGVVAENLVAFQARVESLQGEASRLAKQIQQVLASFASEIDRADSDIY
jgi:hypothetical protein